MNKRGQIALWVILALVLVGAVLLFFFLEQRPIGVAEARFNPEQFLEKCTTSAVNEVVEKIIPQGGFLEPVEFKIYNDTKVPYLCKSDGYYGPCINLHPMLINEINKEIKNYIAPRIENCFESMKTEVERNANSVEFGSVPTEVEVTMAPGKVFVNVAKDVKINEKGTIRSFEKFDVETASPIYDLTSIAINIANHERRYCYFEYLGYMALDTSVDIRKFAMSDSTKIYSIRDKASGKIMNIATRSCAIPAGI